MVTKKLTSFTLSFETAKKMDEYCKEKLINKSKFVEWLINNHIDNKNDKNKKGV